jgi:uncharacterized phiE125 gp8 family phage protein
MSLIRTVQPTDEPLTIHDARQQCRVDTDEDDNLIADYLQAAREFCEEFTSRTFLTTTWRMRMDGFPNNDGPIILPRPPLQTVTSVTYQDTAGVATVLASSKYTIDSDSEPGRIILAYGQSWPSVRDIQQAVTVVFIAGWMTASAIPAAIRKAVAATTGTFYGLRESVAERKIEDVPHAAEMLLWQHRIWYRAA